ncbi:TPA: hypothetical protein VGS93_005738 [Bacillus cereus]|nr:hypothetical protein [Bacillus cereus]
MNVFTNHGDIGGSPIKDFILNSHGDTGCKMGAHGNGGGSRNQHGNTGGSPLKEHGKGI